ncbi:MAG: hypothetical protein AUJ20_01195 [Comamonadaceae bacterium CG1_02_60_18]|nr:MAG: hypothetical protein AUJ20_01195 [Comamonadaceae bacterium CG1_02_60_18]PIQ53911.1 MAG: DUF4124 domain-containing protein [Comamonadaceae bacterium CG12_big_fil_rev_8_21_14_0_65_59_15]
MKHLARWSLLIFCSASSLAFAQWQWLDKDGRNVFSDRAPPVSVPDKAIVKRPGAPQLAPAVNATDTPAKDTASAPVGTTSAPQGLGIDKVLLEKKKKADAEQAAKAKADEQRQLAIKANNCQRAKSAKAGLNSGVRLSRTNAQGERELLDDSARAVEAKRIQSIIDSDCK